MHYKSLSILRFIWTIILFGTFPLMVNAGTVTLDQTFNGTGYRLHLIQNEGLYGTSVRFQSDGRLVLGGHSFDGFSGPDRFALMRVNPNGSLDATFNNGGLVLNRVGNFNNSKRVEILPDGKPLLAGFRYFGSSNNDFVALRYEANGTLDNSFDGNGVASPNTAGFWDDYLYDMVVQSDGKIILVGDTAPSTTIGKNLPTNIAVMRLNTDGSLDPTFGSGGQYIADINGLSDSARAVAIQPDGKIILGGFTNDGVKDVFMLTRLNANGQIDSTFGKAGYSFSSVSTGNDRIRSLTLKSDGKIVAAGGNYIVQYNNNGIIDSQFGQSGVVNVNFTINQIRILPNDKFLTVGNSVRVSRYNRDGSVDLSFNGTGTVTASASGLVCEGMSVDILNGRIAVGGSCYINGGSTLSSRFAIFVFKEDTGKRPPYDFDADGKTDISIYRPSAGEWWIDRSRDGVIVGDFGDKNDLIAPGDFTGDGKDDFALFRPSEGSWLILRSENYVYYGFPFGSNGDQPVVQDYDGDGRTDVAVFRPSTATWFIIESSGQTVVHRFGAAGDVPAPADYDGDGKADIAIYRPQNGEWWINGSSQPMPVYTFGTAEDKNVQADYTGDGKADVAIWRPSTGEWFVLRSEDTSFYSFPFGLTSDKPVIGDFDGDGKSDAGVYRPSNGTWYINLSTSGYLIRSFGIASDIPIPNYGVRN